MSWIESHAAVARHPKTHALMRALQVNKREAIGLLQMLWWWALDFAPEGCLGAYTPADVADAVEWDADAERLVEALVSCRWLDRDADGALHIHDWDEYAGRLIDRRRQNAERKRKARASTPPRATNASGGRPPDATSDESQRPALPDHTGAAAAAPVPDPTGPDRTGPAAVAAVAPATACPEAEAIVEAFYEQLGVEPHGLTRSVLKRELAIGRQLAEAGATADEARRFIAWCRAGPYRPVPSDLRVYEQRRAQFLARLEPVSLGPPGRNGISQRDREELRGAEVLV